MNIDNKEFDTLLLKIDALLQKVTLLEKVISEAIQEEEIDSEEGGSESEEDKQSSESGD